MTRDSLSRPQREWRLNRKIVPNHQVRTVKLRDFASVVLTALALACDHSPDASLLMPDPETPATAGSFEVDAPCRTILESPSGGVFTFSKPSTSILSLKVDSRKPDGTVVWSRTLPSEGTSCIAAVTASSNVVVAAYDSVFSLNGQTGEIRWRVALRVTRDIATSSTGRIFVTQGDGMLEALADADGSVLWTTAVDGPGAPIVDDVRSTVYQIRRGGAAALDMATGNFKWQTPLASALTINAAIASDGTILTSQSNDFSGAITAYGTDGTRLWRNETLTPRQPIGAPVIDDAGTAYAAAFNNSFQGGVYAFSTATGETKWTHDFRRVYSNVAVDSTRTVYVIAQATADSALTLYGLRDGAIVSATAAQDPSFEGLITIHSNHLLYYAGSNKVSFVPTAGVRSSAAWPVDRHDAKRSGRR